MGFRAISIVLFSLFLVTSPVHALSVVGPDDWAQVVYDAELIIVGFPIDSGTSHRVGDRFIVTDWQVFPQYVLLGSTSYEPLTVRTAGGAVDGVAIDGMSLRPVGTPYLFLLRSSDEACIAQDNESAAPASRTNEHCNIWQPTLEFIGIQPVRSLNVMSAFGQIVVGIPDPDVAHVLRAVLEGTRFTIDYVPFTP